MSAGKTSEEMAAALLVDRHRRRNRPERKAWAASFRPYPAKHLAEPTTYGGQAAIFCEACNLVEITRGVTSTPLAVTRWRAIHRHNERFHPRRWSHGAPRIPECPHCGHAHPVGVRCCVILSDIANTVALCECRA